MGRAESLPDNSGEGALRRDQRAFEHLLTRLDSNRDRAGRSYEELRRKMIDFFSWHGLVDAETLADECLNRLADKLLEGEEIRRLEAYLFGVARLVMLEAFRREERRRQMLSQMPTPETVQPEPEDDEPVRRCLGACLGKLPIETRRLIMEYYRGGARERIDRRHSLARELGVSANALRNRALRLRTKLESCVRRCRDRGSEKK